MRPWDGRIFSGSAEASTAPVCECNVPEIHRRKRQTITTHSSNAGQRVTVITGWNCTGILWEHPVQMLQIPQAHLSIEQVQLYRDVSLNLTLPTDKSGGFLVRRPLRRILGLGVLHDLPKREFPCAPRYFCYARLPWLCSPRLAAGYSLPRYGRGRDALRTAGTSIRGRALYPQP